jgi:hypothetical protein
MRELGAMEKGCGHLLVFSFEVTTLFVKGDSYPELSAQRTAEGGGFLW